MGVLTWVSGDEARIVVPAVSATAFPEMTAFEPAEMRMLDASREKLAHLIERRPDAW